MRTKTVLVVAGNYAQFDHWCREMLSLPPDYEEVVNWDSERTEYLYYSDEGCIRGLPSLEYVLIVGNGYLRTDVDYEYINHLISKGKFIRENQ